MSLLFAQIIRTPAARRPARPYVEPETSPWRKTILITERGSCRVENWFKIHGIGSTENKEERYRSERIQWAVHVFARQRLRRTGTEPAESGEVPDVEDVLRGLGASADLPEAPWRFSCVSCCSQKTVPSFLEAFQSSLKTTSGALIKHTKKRNN